ncbi:potassium channel family protein [Halobellus ordinarius]|uniref:potassium channel family protein n=1 Tax=Halobellus ordinarius TaxID=3075120 RepID=UPI002880A62F|nr:potassium channel family protein [Halobellus sp. ZY16]
MSRCTYRYTVDGAERTCPRPTTGDHERCVFHLTPDERRAAEVTPSELRTAFLADVTADDPARREYVDVDLTGLDLSALVIDGDDVGRITFREITVERTLDLSGSVVRHPLAIADSRIGQLDVTGASAEMDVTVEGTAFGATSEQSVALRARRGAFERNLEVRDTEFGGTVECAACRVDGWLDFDDVILAGGGHFPNAALGRVQFVATEFQQGAEFVGAAVEHATFDRVGSENVDTEFDPSETSVGELRVFPAAGLRCRLTRATVSEGHLDQPDSAVATYDLTDATVGDVDLDCEPDTFDRYRFYRTRFEGFPFAAYREVLRANDWRLHEYIGDAEATEDTDGLEHTYLEAKQGASGVGDGETASMFFVRELRYRRQRYASHAASAAYTPAHRFDAGVRWLTNAFLDTIAGYGERPQRTALLAGAVIAVSALVYPATAGLSSGNQVVNYGSHGAVAALDGLYFSIVTFATLGLGDVHPVGDVGRFLAASEGLAGAFLTAVFVFSLGRRVTR